MTEKNNFEKGNSSLSNHKMKKGTSKNSWKHQMYELEIAIAKESSNKRRNELIKIHNGYMSEYDSLKKQIIWLAVLGICFLLVLVVFGYFIWNSYNSENMSYTSSGFKSKYWAPIELSILILVNNRVSRQKSRDFLL